MENENTSIEEFAKKEKFAKLTANSHPSDGQIVEILGPSLSKPYNIEKVKWNINNGQHSYTWVTHEFNKGIMTTSLDYWRTI